MTQLKNIKVIKRDGRVVDFEATKIYNAISKAYNQVKDDFDYEPDLIMLTNAIITEIFDRFDTD